MNHSGFSIPVNFTTNRSERFKIVPCLFRLHENCRIFSKILVWLALKATNAGTMIPSSQGNSFYSSTCEYV